MAYFGLKLGLDLEMRVVHPDQEFQGVPPPPYDRVGREVSKKCSLMITFVFCPQFIALVLICVAVYAKVSTKVTIDVSLPIVGGVIACGVFLLLVAIMGVAGAIRHSQVILFFVSFTLRLCFYLA